MKHIKIYEKYISKKKPHVGDYILSNVDFFDKKYENFVNSNIGKIIRIYSSEHGDKADIEYQNISFDILYMFDTNDLNKNKTTIWAKDIIYFSKSKKDVEEYLLAKKYNL